jgi:signal transduction histidine kinase
MKFWPRIFLLGAAFLALAQTGRGQSTAYWRVYKVNDGLHQSTCVSVSVTPSGKVLVRHPDGTFISELDGYNVKSMAPPEPAIDFSGSPGDRLWVMARDGLLEEFKQGAWVMHPAPETNAASDVIAPFYPAREDHIIFLCADRLVEYNAENPGPPQTRVLLRSGQTRLGTFTGMTVAHDGGLWITGERGLGKVPKPAIYTGLEKSWHDYLPPESLQIHNLREPRADEEGGVTLVAESLINGNKMVVRFNGLDWTAQPAGVEGILCAWRSGDKILWFATTDSLFQQAPGQTGFARYQEISPRQFFDMAMEPDGTFWLAMSGGLFHYAPPLWCSPRPIQQINTPIRCLTEDAAGRLWFVAAGKLHSLQDETHHEFALPEPGARDAQSIRALFPLKDGTLLLDADDRSFQFRPDTGAFSVVPAPKDVRQPRPLGLLMDGSLCFQGWTSETTTGKWIAYCFDLFDGNQFKPLADPPPPSPNAAGYRILFAARNGDLWLNGDQGIAWYHEKKWQTFPVSERAVPGAVIGFTELTDGRIWCATSDTLWEFDGHSWSSIYSGFDHINALQCARNGSVWVADDAGVHRFFQNTWIENSREEGLPDTAVQIFFEDQHKRIWAGTSYGLSLYHPEADQDPPGTFIQKQGEKETRIREGDTLTLAFSGQDKWKFTPQERLLYSWRLDERDWSAFQPSDNVSFSDLAPGRHYFQVRAMDRNGNVDPKPASLEFMVTVPWYKEIRLVLIALAGAAVALFFAALAFNRHWQLLRSHAEVEKKVAERTRELEIAGRELLHSQKMNALGTLAAGIAHDFNNILSIIKGSVQLIEENPGNPQKIRTRVDRIKTVVEQGAGIVNAMLGFSSGGDEQPGPCDLNLVMADTVRLLGDRFLREVHVKYESAPDLPKIRSMKNLIQQILLNFIFNAAEAMTVRKEVILSTQKLERLPASLVLAPVPAPAYVSVSVCDFGCGIPPENLPRIFEPFFTTKALSARRGTGLGLSMVYELAKKMEAGLAVESTVGQGSTFTLILPVRELPPEAKA